jgi:TIR domain/NB-ARC domain
MEDFVNTEPEMRTPTTPCCVFISYSSADRVMAEELQRDLEGLGFDVWRDQTRLELDWSSEISRALVDIADVMCLLWTPAAATSKWVQHEWLTARAVGKWIIPCLMPNGPALPPALSHVHGIVIATGVVIADAVAARIRQVRPREVAYDYAPVPPGVDIPFGHNPGFVGGRRELAELYRSMVGNLDKAAPGFAGIVGMAGAGKTQLAIEFAVRFGFAFESVLWLPAGGPVRWFDSLVGLAKAMYTKGRLKLPAAVGTGSDLEFFVELRRAFEGHAQTLLIVDNVADPRMLASPDVLPGTGCTMLTLGASVLFTTRSDFDLAGVNRHKLDMLSEPEALRLLTRSRLPTNDVEVRAAADICNVMGYLPLALVLAAGLLRWRTDVSYADYLAELARDRLDTIDAASMASEALATRHDAVIRRTLIGQLAALEGDPMAGFASSACLPRPRSSRSNCWVGLPVSPPVLPSSATPSPARSAASGRTACSSRHPADRVSGCTRCCAPRCGPSWVPKRRGR